MRGEQNTGKLDCYVPRVLLRRLATVPDQPVLTLEGTVVFADLSGFTRLSERLARAGGNEGAEQLTDAINWCFSALLADAYAHGGGLLKFGGDAMLLWFEGAGHPLRACAAAAMMRARLRQVGRLDAGNAKVVLRVSVGVHSGKFEMFLVGESHREHLIAGPAATRVVELEAAASAGQILLSPETAELLPNGCLGAASGPGVLLARQPTTASPLPEEAPARPSDDAIAGCLSTALREHVSTAPATPEHRNATIGFVRFGGVDALIEGAGVRTAASVLQELMRIVQDAAELFQVCLFESDVYADGGKLMLAAGAPRALGDDEERMLLVARHIIDSAPPLPVRIGVNRGHIFAGEIGPHYRRTYALMGDAVNLGARLMAKAPWGRVYATESVLERSKTIFETTAISPFTAKGKLRPVTAVEVGPMRRPVATRAAQKRLPLLGRDRELGAIRDAVAAARAGRGGIVELVGETGSGKSRLLGEARQLAGGLRTVHTICENYRKTVSYAVWRDLLRQLLGLHWDDRDDVVIARILQVIKGRERELSPWLPLLAIVLDVEVTTTREVEELAPQNRATKLHEVVLEFLEPLLAVPTLVQIEHAHFMDAASASLLDAIALRLESSAWLIALTRRKVAKGFSAAPSGSTRLTLGPLSDAAMTELAQSAPEASQIPPHVLETAVQRAGGSPEFLLDLLAAAAGGSGALPAGVDAATSARIDELDPRDRALVRRASVLGLCFHPRLLRHVLEAEDPSPGKEDWNRLSAVFADDGDGYVRFRRPALCEVAYEGLPFRLRRRLHSAVGRALEPDVGRDADADPAVLSLHFSLAGAHDLAWKYAIRGAERASMRFAHADAAQLYRRAIEAGRHADATEGEMAGAWESLGRALHRTGELAAAADAMTEARRLVVDDPLAQGRLFYWHTIIAEHAARLTTAVRWANRGRRLLEGLGQREAVMWRARILARLAFYRGRQGRLREAERICREAIGEAESIDELDAQGYAYWTLDWVRFELGRLGEERYSDRALEIYERLGDLEQQGNVLNNLAVYAAEEWRWDEALELLKRSAQCSERAGIHGGVAATEVNIAEIMIDRGQYDEASPHLRRARRLWKSTGVAHAPAYVDVLQGRLDVRAGRHGEGLALLRQATEDLRSRGEQAYTEFAESVLAEAEAFAGDSNRALEIANRLISGADRTLPLLHRIRTIALGRLGDPTAGDALAMSLALARERDALHDLALGLDVAQRLWGTDPARVLERDALIARLGIERLPGLPTSLMYGLTTSSAARAS